MLDGRPPGLTTSGARESDPNGTSRRRTRRRYGPVSKGLVPTRLWRSSQRLPRATHAEYRRTVSDILGGMACRTGPARRGTLAACRRSEDVSGYADSGRGRLGSRVRRHLAGSERGVRDIAFSCVLVEQVDPIFPAIQFSKWRAVLTRDHKILRTLSAPRSMPELFCQRAWRIELRSAISVNRRKLKADRKARADAEPPPRAPLMARAGQLGLHDFLWCPRAPVHCRQINPSGYRAGT
jgi:hypothetical protein